MRLIIASLLVFSVVILFLFALFPSEISVSRVIQINKPGPEVQKKIADLREWKSWNDFLYPAGVQDGKPEVSGKTDSIKISRSDVTVDLLSVAQDTILTRWRRGDKSFVGSFYLTELNGQTIVDWTMHFHISWYPWEKLASMFYEKQLGPQLEKSLLKLRNELEKPAR